jgi:septal ring-binding cell division protein DamX
MGKVATMTPHNSAVTSVLCLLLVTTLSGCAKNKPPEPLLGIPDKEHVPWFCQTGEETDRWDCVRDEKLASNPKPTRSPPPSADGSERTMPNFSRGRQSPPTQPAAKPVTPVRQTETKESTAGSASNSPEATTGNRQQPPNNAQDTNIPKHIRLAYRPDKAVNLVDLPSKFWAVQLVALSSKEALEEYATERGVRGMSAAEVAVKDKIFYVLLLGIYETKEIAQDASSELGPTFNNPWIRSVGSLQAAMLEAERVKGQH